MSQLPLAILWPIPFAIACALVVFAIAAGWMRRAALPGSSVILAIAGLLCFCFAAGGVTWRRESPGRLAVMIDLSPSTRTATFRDGAELSRRIEKLIGDTSYSLYQFADQTVPGELSRGPVDMHANRTVFSPPPDADAVLVFTDAQFEPPEKAVPTYVVFDRALEQPADAAVERLQARSDSVTATIRNTGLPREASVNAEKLAQSLESRRSVITRPLAPNTRDATVHLDAADPWPQNDSLVTLVPPPRQLQRWWVGDSPPPLGWRAIKPAELTPDPVEYLSAGVIALDNLPVDALTRLHHERLFQYVRQMGGGLLILGGDRAFAAGHYPGSHLEMLSPLSSTPPTPATHWVLLADSSGSMAARIGDNSRWAFAINAIVRVIPLLPASDAISAGNFAQDVHWWRRGTNVGEIGPRPLSIVPVDVQPRGPTNVGTALRDVAQSADAATPTQVLLITDAEASLDSAQGLTDLLVAKEVRVSVLTTGPLTEQNPLRAIVEQTGGTIVAQSDPRHWAMALRGMVRSSTMSWLQTSTLNVAFTTSGPSLPSLSATPWNRTWLKAGATELASGRAGEPAPAIAGWNSGSGAVIAAAFRPTHDVITALAVRVMVPPRDPRFTVTWDLAQPLRVTLDAIEDRRFMNGVQPMLELWPEPAQPQPPRPLTQTAPGRYEHAMTAPSRQMIAKLTLDGRTLDLVAIAGRYPIEYEAIGNNRANATRLAQMTGGAVIEPARDGRIDFRWPTRTFALWRYAAIAGAVCVAAAVIRWRLK